MKTVRAMHLRLMKPVSNVLRSWVRSLALGVDTVSFAWRGLLHENLKGEARWAANNGVWCYDALTTDEDGASVTSMPLLPLDEVEEAPAYRMGPDSVRIKFRGLSVLIWPSHNLLRVEGRSELFSSITEPRLRPLTDLPKMAEHASELLSVLMGGVEFPASEARISRIDLAADLRPLSAADGLEFLEALSNAEVPGFKVSSWRNSPRTETVSFVSARKRTSQQESKSICLRAYDKASEQGEETPGSWLRIERQLRFANGKRPSVAELAHADGGSLWLDRVEALKASSRAWPAHHSDDWEMKIFEGIGRTDVLEPRKDRVQPFKARHAVRLIGEVRAVGRFGDRWFDDTGQGRRRRLARGELAALGVLSVADRAPDDQQKISISQTFSALRYEWPAPGQARNGRRSTPSAEPAVPNAGRVPAPT
jgi:hypothetical protein